MTNQILPSCLQRAILVTPPLSFPHLQTNGDTDSYTLHTRVPETLPVVDVEATSPAADEKLQLALGEVCFA